MFSDLDNYLPVLIIMAGVVGLAVFLLAFSRWAGRKGRATPLRDTAYECGMPLLSSSQARFSVKFYVIAMLFILFDIEVVFLYPWATIIDQAHLGVPPVLALVEMLIFVTVLFVGWIYIVRKGVLDWNR
jgi:NADH-quinone oxidoreductase subunit A